MRKRGCDRPTGDASFTWTPSGCRVEAADLGCLGRVWAVREAGGRLWELHVPGLHDPEAEAPAGAHAMADDLRAALEAYAMGDDGPLLALPLGPAPTAFAREVREAMRSIPRGELRTYGALARQVGRPGAARAIGRACATNPLPILVPCHRVVAAGGIGGYALGLEAKRRLLALEGIDVAMGAGFR